MADGKLIFKSETQYDIEVAGGIISFDTSDIDLPKKVKKMISEYQGALKDFEEANIEDEEDILKELDKFFNRVYKGIDALFGEGASKMIFPTRLMSTLEPFFEGLANELEKAGVKQEEYFKKRTSPEYRSKYAPQDHLPKRKKL